MILLQGSVANDPESAQHRTGNNFKNHEDYFGYFLKVIIQFEVTYLKKFTVKTFGVEKWDKLMTNTPDPQIMKKWKILNYFKIWRYFDYKRGIGTPATKRK